MRSWRPETKVIALTRFVGPDDIIAALRAHVFACFAAPFDTGEIVRMACTALRARDWRDGIEVVSDPYDACDGADVLLVLTEWDEFKWLDLGEVKARMATPAVVDARNLLDRSALIRRGFTFRGIGRR